MKRRSFPGLYRPEDYCPVRLLHSRRGGIKLMNRLLHAAIEPAPGQIGNPPTAPQGRFDDGIPETTGGAD